MISQRICRSAFVEAVTISLARHSVMFAVCLGRNRSRCPGFMEGFGIFVLFPCNARVSSSHLLHLACTHYEPSSSITRCTSRALIMSHHPLPHAAPRVHSLWNIILHHTLYLACTWHPLFCWRRLRAFRLPFCTKNSFPHASVFGVVFCFVLCQEFSPHFPTILHFWAFFLREEGEEEEKRKKKKKRNKKEVMKEEKEEEEEE